MNTTCPPSNAGSGKRLINPTLIQISASKLSTLTKPALDAAPTIVYIPTGPDNN